MQKVRQEGTQAVLTNVDSITRQTVRSHEIEPWPRSPGLFGLYYRALATLGSLRVGALSVNPFSQIGRWFSGPQEVPSSPMPADILPDHLGSMLHRRIQDLRSAAAKAGVPHEWVAERWQAAAASLRPDLAEASDKAVVELVAKPSGSLRRLLGIAALTILECALASVLLMSVWRLGWSFFTANYLGSPFVANLVALLIGLLLIGHVTLSVCFPRPEHLLRRQLETRLRATWEDLINGLERTATDYLDATGTLHDEGKTFAQKISNEIIKSSSTSSELAEDATAVDPLFARSQPASNRFS